jgi:hypothetical protein
MRLIRLKNVLRLRRFYNTTILTGKRESKLIYQISHFQKSFYNSSKY